MKFMITFQDKNRFKRGFSLMEVLVAMFIFSLVIVSVAEIFGSSIHGYRKGASMQQDLESAELALNSIAKVLRTSSVSGSSGTTTVRIFDYSQGACISYQFGTNALEMAIASGVSSKNDCDTASPFSYTPLVSARSLTGGFNVTPSSDVAGNKEIGKITIYLDISEDGEHHAKMQTTVSLRDYSYVGL